MGGHEVDAIRARIAAAADAQSVRSDSV